jgi:hypothetical protein
MKKLLAMFVALLFVAAAGLYADKTEGGMNCDGGMGWMMMKGADFKAEKAANGANIIITTKEKGEVAGLQDKAEQMVKWHKEAMGKMGDKMPMMGMCPFCVKGADTQLRKTADGATLMITAKDPKAVSDIQEKAMSWVEMKSKMPEGMLGQGMMMRGMGMEGGLASHIQKKMAIAFKFMIVIWSLLIILIAATIVLVIKKIVMK